MFGKEQQSVDADLGKELKENPLWKVAAMGRFWICPFCGKPVTKAKVEKERLAEIEAHLDGGPCGEKWEEEEYPYSREMLEERARKVEIFQYIQIRPSWKVTGDAGHWVCPVCMRVTGVTFGTKPAGAVPAIYRHLEKCCKFNPGWEEGHPAEEVQEIASQQKKSQEFLGMIRQNLETKPNWQVKNSQDTWVCPFCRQAIGGISIPTRFLLLETAPLLVAKHLKDRCAPFRKNQPAASAEELQKQVQVPVKEEKKGGAQDNAWAQSVMTEIQEMKSRMTMSVQLEKSLEEAKRKQEEMLPQHPEIPGFTFATMYRPCSRIGGDFYDFVPIVGDRIGIAMGDVSGHGIEAALVMSMTKKLLNVYGKVRTSAKETLVAANKDLYEDLDRKTFVTVFYGILDPAGRTFSCARAGHNPVVRFNPKRDPQVTLVKPSGFFMGVDPGDRFASVIGEEQLDLIPGDMILLYTDGLIEARNKQEEEWGMDRLVDRIQQYGGSDPEYLVYRLEREVQEFSEGLEQADDIAIVAFHYQP